MRKRVLREDPLYPSKEAPRSRGWEPLPLELPLAPPPAPRVRELPADEDEEPRRGVIVIDLV